MAPDDQHGDMHPSYGRTRDAEMKPVNSASDREARQSFFRALSGSLVLLIGSAILASTVDSGPLVRTFSVLALLVSLFWLSWTLFLPRTETLSQWQLLLDGKAPLAEVAYQVIHMGLLARQVPVWIEPVRLKLTNPEWTVRNYLRVLLPPHQVIVSVFPFGRDLYLSWTMIRREMPVRGVLRWIRSLFGSGVNYDEFIDMEPVQALREVVHHAMWQGIEATAARVGMAPAAAAFGEDRPAQQAPSEADVPGP